MPIYDTSYRHIEGVRNVSRVRFVPIVTTGARLFLKKRQAKTFLLLAALPLFFGIIALILPGVMTSAAGQRMQQALAPFLDMSGAYMWILLAKLEWLPVFLITLFAGGGLIANDLRANAAEVYFSRPVTRLDYVLGKLGALLVLLLAVTFLPAFFLWLLDVLLDEKVGYLAQQLPLLPRIAAASLVVTVPYALLMLAVSAIAGTARNAMIVFAGFILMTKAVGTGLSEGLEDARYGAISFDACIEKLASWALDTDFGRLPGIDVGMPPIDAPVGLPLLVVAGVMLVCIAALARRVRAVEVVAA